MSRKGSSSVVAPDAVDAKNDSCTKPPSGMQKNRWESKRTVENDADTPVDV
jgi:hypothetical protein